MHELEIVLNDAIRIGEYACELLEMAGVDLTKDTLGCVLLTMPSRLEDLKDHEWLGQPYMQAFNAAIRKTTGTKQERHCEEIVMKLHEYFALMPDNEKALAKYRMAGLATGIITYLSR